MLVGFLEWENRLQTDKEIISVVATTDNYIKVEDHATHCLMARIIIYIYMNVFFWPFGIFSLPTAGLSSCSRLRGTQGTHLDPIR